MPNNPFTDGVAAFASLGASRFTDLQAKINGLTRDDVFPESIGQNNGPSPVITNDNAIGDYIREALSTGIYTNTYPGYATATIAGTGPGGGAGWRFLDSVAVISFPAHALDAPAVAPYTTGYKVAANVHLYAIRDTGAAVPFAWKACVAILWRSPDKVWHVVARSERDTNAVEEPQASGVGDGRCRMDLALSAFITPLDLDLGAGPVDIEAIGLAVAFYNDGGPAPIGTAQVELRDYTFSALPMRVGYP